MLSIHTGQPASTAPKLPIFAALAQGFFCIVIGLWAVVDFSAFVNVTAQKPDQWLVTLAGLLLASIGASMIISAFRRDIAFEVFFIGLAAALSLAATDIFFVIKGVCRCASCSMPWRSCSSSRFGFSQSAPAGPHARRARKRLPPPLKKSQNRGGPMQQDEPVSRDYIALGFEKIERDLHFLIHCLEEVLTSLGHGDLAALLPWTGRELPADIDRLPPRPASSSRSPSSS